ncbi:MAG: SagB family peptide dehydrogenase [Verrucomicrobia bacterium]|nr:SagB family peptide dehydrogenase [Verrucomicrobiota bacterium]
MKIQLKPEPALKEKSVDLAQIGSAHLHSSVFEHLKNGIDEEKLADEVLKTHGDSGLASFYYLLNLLKKHALLNYKTSLIDWVPMKEACPPDSLCTNGLYRISPFAMLRAEDGCFVIETPLYPVRITLLSQEMLILLDLFRKPVTIAEALSRFSHVEKTELEQTLALLQQAKVLTLEESNLIQMQWEPHDLYFHSRSRMGKHDSIYGGSFPFQGKIPPPSCKKTYPSSDAFPLKKPDSPLPISLEEAIESRKTVREHASSPLCSHQLGEFLFRCARVKETLVYLGEEFAKRPYPGGGARHELEIYPVIYACEGLQKGVYHYDPFEHSLKRLSNLTEEAEKLLRDACTMSGKTEYPQVLFVISARFQRVSWKYRSMSYALILKNLGVLYQTMYLVATGMGLAPCALGGGNSDLFCKVIGTDYLEETSVGEFMLGSRNV